MQKHGKGSSAKTAVGSSAAASGDFAETMASVRPSHPYFTEFTARKAVMYTVAVVYVLGAGLASVVELVLDLPCYDPGVDVGFENPAYDGTKCPHIRHAVLLGLTRQECSFGRRLVASVLMGGVVGWERRQADRPAGIRTMSLVSLGSCLFTITSAFAFVDGPMNWDASRISAAIPSGVGFLGAGLIFKKEEVVHGLTTAASVWLSAAVGIACGGELYFAASFGVAIMMLLLRFGPRAAEGWADEDDNNDEEHNDDEEAGCGNNNNSRTVVFQNDMNLKGILRSPGASGEAGGTGVGGYGSAAPSLRGDLDLEAMSQETASLIRPTTTRARDTKSLRQRAALGSYV